MLKEIVEHYIEIFPEERKKFVLLHKQLAAGERLNDRQNYHGHITGSGIILSPDKRKILLIHHKLFNHWQQPGGHWESCDEANPFETAKRESEEETGVRLGPSLAVDTGHPLVP